MFVRADMRRFDLGGTFDGIICMDGAYAHVLTEHHLLKQFRTARRHVSPDGVSVFEFAQALKAETGEPGIDPNRCAARTFRHHG